MNKLPDYRRAVHGRTYSQPWNPSGFDPFRRYQRTPQWVTRLGAALVAAAVFAVSINFFR